MCQTIKKSKATGDSRLKLHFASVPARPSSSSEHVPQQTFFTRSPVTLSARSLFLKHPVFGGTPDEHMNIQGLLTLKQNDTGDTYVTPADYDLAPVGVFAPGDFDHNMVHVCRPRADAPPKDAGKNASRTGNPEQLVSNLRMLTRVKWSNKSRTIKLDLLAHISAVAWCDLCKLYKFYDDTIKFHSPFT
ncbi:hypothetical protein L596_006126 [Steinernema carpocapsae]|uniref:Uncharacterized protein n=1 Tax=Steinernema carpocapsae TaxID=34508 RepID=A0A4V6I8P2_STECR|nr:hypothetical protein L596_006126 [Steinernema carpocapsae]